MNHSKILKESFALVLKNKYLWFLGILLGAGSGANFYSYNNSDPGLFKQNESGQNVADLSTSLKDAGQVLGDKISTGISNTEWIVIAVLALILILAAIYLNFTAKGAATWATVKLQAGEKFGLADAWKTGHKYFWRRFSFDIIVGASILVILMVLAAPVILLAIFQVTILAVILGILFGLAFLAFIIYLSLILPYSERALFLDNKKTFQAVFAGYKLFNKNWVNLVLMYLILFAIGIAAAIGIAIAIIICLLLAFGVGAAFYYLNHILGYTIGGLLGLAAFVALIIFGGALQSFSWAAITLSYKEVK